MRKVLFTILFLFLGTAVFAQIPVTFQVDMGVQAAKGLFVPGTDIVVIRGSFQTDAGDPNGDWQGGMFELADADGDTIYTLTVDFPADSAGKEYAYKFVKNSDGWESSSDRTFTLTGPSQELDVVYFNNDDTYPSGAEPIPVTFQLDMGPQVFRGSFDPATEIVVIRGNFQTDAGDPGGDWQGSMFQLTDDDADTIYTLTVDIPAEREGTTFEFKYVKNDDGWESIDNRTFTLTGPSQILPAVYYNNDGTYPTTTVTNTLNFTADISGILGIGAGGAFDPEQDSLLVVGLDWEGGENVQGERRMVEDPFTPGIYTTTLSVTKTGDSTKWKYRAFATERFSNDGYETGDDRWYVYGEDGAVVDLPVIVPRISPVFPALENDVEMIFRVDMTNAKNQYNNEPIDPASLEFVGLRGGADWLGSWSSGNWMPSDTTTGNMKVLNDDGVNGDLQANDNIWSISIIVPAGTNGGLFEYKYGAMYPGADTVNGGSTPLDNEGGFGHNHQVLLQEGGPYIMNDRFGDYTTAVERIDDGLPTKYILEQNYPNPFNPSTKIRYSIPVEGHVKIKIYNLIGEYIGDLVNEVQRTGTYEVTFDAGRLAAGVYFYTISVGDYTATKKMMLLK